MKYVLAILVAFMSTGAMAIPSTLHPSDPAPAGFYQITENDFNALPGERTTQSGYTFGNGGELNFSFGDDVIAFGLTTIGLFNTKGFTLTYADQIISVMGSSLVNINEWYVEFSNPVDAFSLNIDFTDGLFNYGKAEAIYASSEPQDPRAVPEGGSGIIYFALALLLGVSVSQKNKKFAKTVTGVSRLTARNPLAI